MTYPNRPDWVGLTRAGTVVWVVVLVAGVPYAFVPAGCPMTAVRWSGSASDPAFWPALALGTTTGIPTRGWLSLKEGLELSFGARPVSGQVDVGVPRIVLSDTGTPDSPTGLFGNATGAASSPLTATMLATDFTATVRATAPLGAVGTVVRFWCGQEAMQGTVHDATSITGISRGLYGSAVTVHPAGNGSTAARLVAAIPSLVGRRVSIFLVPQDPTDPTGVTGLDPELRFDGVVCSGSGAQNATWPLQLAAHVNKPGSDSPAVAGSFAVTGIAHMIPPPGRGTLYTYPTSIGPLAANWDDTTMCLTTTDTNGWSANAQAFLALWQHTCTMVTFAGGGILTLTALGDGRALIQAGGVSSTLLVTSLLFPDAWVPDQEDTDTSAVFTTPVFPDVFMPFDRLVYLTPGDAAQIPATPAPVASTYDITQTTRIYWTLVAVIGGSPKIATVGASTPAGIMTLVSLGATETPTSPTARDWLITEPTVLTLGAYVTTPAWWEGLHALATALNGVPGAGVIADAYDWQDIAAQAVALSTQGCSFARSYPVDLTKSFQDLFAQEVRFAGGAVIVRRGRITWCRFAEVPTNSPTAATLTKLAARRGTAPDVQEARDRVVTSFVAKGSTGSYTINDDVAAAEAGGVATAWKADIPAGVEPPRLDAAFFLALQTLGLTTIAPWRRVYRTMTFKGTLALLAATPGDVVAIPDDWLVPNDRGSRGFSGVGQVLATTERFFTGGQDGVDLTLRLTLDPLATPYAPELLIAAGGITTGSGVLVVDETAGGLAAGGLEGFGDPATSRHGGADSFQVGDRVRLIQVGIAAPAAPFDCTVTATNTSGHPATVTVSPAPDTTGATWVAYSAAAVGVMLTYQDYASATNAGQHLYAFVADTTAGSIVVGVQPDQWQA